MAHHQYNVRNGYNQWTPMHQQQADQGNMVYKPVVPPQQVISEKDTIPTYRQPTFMQKYFGGTKRTLRTFAALGCVVLIINVSWLGYAKAKYGIEKGYGTIKSGNCGSVKAANTWYHLAINTFSTLLLTGSNAFMAAYSAPTREEVDRSHSKGRWLHVGCMSFRNMLGISGVKSLICLLLAFSSVPFHLLYNSLVFTSLSANNYYWIIATRDFVSGAPFDLAGVPASLHYTDYHPPRDYFLEIQQSASNWQQLDQKACIEAYSNSFVFDRRNVILVSSLPNATTSITQYGSATIDTDIDNNWWICSEVGQMNGYMQCNPQDFAANAASWRVFGQPIEYCLSERVNSQCSVLFSLDIMLTVVAFNSLKVVAMLWILLRLDAQKLLTCVGDATASFIEQPDRTTEGMCLADKRSISVYWRNRVPRVYYAGQRYRLGRAVSKRRWTFFTSFMLFAWAVVFVFGAWGFEHVHSQGVSLSLSSLYRLGFGTLNQFALVFVGGLNGDYAGGSKGTIYLALLANIPQVFLALIYLIYMGIMTAVFNALDWSRFGKSGQYLMVGSPRGKQRGTWLLGAPWKFGLTLLVLQVLLHWFVSQSLFVVQMTIYDPRGHAVQGEYQLGKVSNCGYSPIAIICAVVASGVLYLTAIVAGFWRLPAGPIPVVSTCSAAISAACHVPPAMLSEATVYEELRWGVTAYSSDGIGHCSLGPAKEWDDGRAGSLLQGRPYAGVTDRAK